MYNPCVQRYTLAASCRKIISFFWLHGFVIILNTLDNIKPFTTGFRVYYEDTDAGGIVYYANYLRFFERARTEWLRALGISQSNFLQHDIAFVVRQVSMDNISPGRLDDFLTITSIIGEFKKASLLFDQQITDQTGRLIAKAQVRVACVNLKKMKPQAIPEQILGAFHHAC